MASRHALVVGGGIGGLAAAIGLHRVGWQVTVLERASELTAIGAGISLWPNAQRALAELGVNARIAPQSGGGLVDWRGRRLASWDADAFVRSHGLPLGAIHRAKLIEALRSALPAESLKTGVEVTAAEPSGIVRCDDGELEADLIVAADGINSPIRQQLFPAARVAYSGGAAFRGIAKLPLSPSLSTTWAAGTEIGILPLPDDEVYWWVCEARPAGIGHEDNRAYLREKYGRWHEPIGQLIDATPEILRHDLQHLATPLPSYVRGKIALLGDSAHAMPPFLGQGGCQALEDAVVLAEHAGKSTVEAALRGYDTERRPRTQKVTKASMRAGASGPLLRNPAAVALRAAFTRLLPSAVTTRIGASVSRWEPPKLTPVPPRTR
ncbi:FAD-dependent monooxygenase [Amycolatopsis benzoatilytica]|uniref:FAD-dependent monooxygenase n=1 Tax=Amycolatopsis benzoatilytica TaxID=346045 RepID=UPI00035F79BE|nr:FAD-dependent monooxygenase [Amycolatopsis benzoatilytica]